MVGVFVVGMAVVDYLFFVDTFPEGGDKCRAYDTAVVGGGCGANAAVAVARLGGRAYLSTRLGNDVAGAMISRDLEQEGVDVSLSDTSGTRSSSSSVLIDRAGERQIVNFRGLGLTEETAQIQAAPEVGAVLADTRWSRGAQAAMDLAQDRAVPGILDIEAPAETAAFFSASHLAFSRPGLAHIYPGTDPGDALARAVNDFGGWACVTDGGGDVLYHGPDGAGSVAGFKVEVVDTLGAGDVWHGAFALGLAEGREEPDAIRVANAAAALKCTRPGGRAGTPDRAETETLMNGTMP